MKAYPRALNSLFDGPVSMEAAAMERFLGIVFPKVDGLEGVAVVASVSNASTMSAPTLEKRGNVAIVPINGAIVNGDMEDDEEEYFGVCSTGNLQRKIAAAMGDDEVEAVALSVASPGGSVLCIAQVAGSINALKAKKPVVTSVRSGMYSAAYWVGCQADEVCLAPGNQLGALGVFSVKRDSSRMYENAGIKVNVVKAGEFKGAGTPGTPVTAEQLAEEQKQVDAYYAMFVDAIAAGRKLSPDAAKALADGRTYIGQAAIEAKLADTLCSFDEAVSRASALGKTAASKARASSSHNKGVQAMSEQEAAAAKDEAIKAERARVKAINEAFAKHPEFAARMNDEGKTLAEAKGVFAEEVLAGKHGEKTEAARGNKAVAVVAKQTAAKADEEVSDDPRAEFNAAIAEKQKVMPHLSRAKATSAVIAENPDLHDAVLASGNPDRGEDVKRMGKSIRSRIGEKVSAY